MLCIFTVFMEKLRNHAAQNLTIREKTEFGDDGSVVSNLVWTIGPGPRLPITPLLYCSNLNNTFKSQLSIKSAPSVISRCHIPMTTARRWDEEVCSKHRHQTPDWEWSMAMVAAQTASSKFYGKYQNCSFMFSWDQIRAKQQQPLTTRLLKCALLGRCSQQVC